MKPIALLPAAILLCASVLSGCDNKPAHYLVICDNQDGQGWSLSDTKEQSGYLISCTYTSPDKANSYTRACDSDGCNVQ